MGGSEAKVLVALAGARPSPAGPSAWQWGGCRLYCGRDGLRVRSLGQVWALPEGELYACARCIAELERVIRGEAGRRRDAVGLCDHARLEKRNGKSFCTKCRRQIYL